MGMTLLVPACPAPRNNPLSFMYNSLTPTRWGGGASMAGAAGTDPAAFFFASAMAAR